MKKMMKMKSIDTYITEKFKISKDIAIELDSDDIIKNYKKTLSEKDSIAFERIVNIAKRQANIKGKPTGVVSMYFDNHCFAWCEWKDNYEINDKDESGNTLIVKINPDNENNK